MYHGRTVEICRDLPGAERDASLPGGPGLLRRNRRSLNLSASVRERLRNVAKELGLEFEPVLIRYAVERLLYRLAVSRQGNQFVVKGAMLFVLWDNNLYRPTRDVDLLGFGRRDPERLARVFREVCEEEVEKDGLRFPCAGEMCAVSL